MSQGPWKLGTKIEADFIGPLFDNDVNKTTLFIRKTKTQRNAITAEFRRLDGTHNTLCWVVNEKRLYQLISEPGTPTTTDINWELAVITNPSETPVGRWFPDNTDPELFDSLATGRNGEYYLVDGAPTEVVVTIPGLFGGEATTVLNGDRVLSVGNQWIVIKNTTDWYLLNRPQVIIDYENGIVIGHTHEMADINGLVLALSEKFDIDDVADHEIPFEQVLDDKLINLFFLKAHYFRKDELYDQTTIDQLLSSKADLVGGKVPLSQLPTQAFAGTIVVPNITARDGYPDKTEGMRFYVLDATGDPHNDIIAGGAEYVYQPSSPEADPSGFVLIEKPSSFIVEHYSWLATADQTDFEVPGLAEGAIVRIVSVTVCGVPQNIHAGVATINATKTGINIDADPGEILENDPITLTYMTGAAATGGNEGTGSSSLGIENRYDTVTLMLNDQVNQTVGAVQFVQNALDDPSVNSGWAEYEYLGPATSSLSNYRKRAEQESMDVDTYEFLSIDGSSNISFEDQSPV